MALLDDLNLIALFIGLMVTVVIVIAFDRGLGAGSRSMARARNVFAFLGGFLTYLVLLENPALLDQYATEIVIALIGLVLAFVAFLRRQF